MNYLKSTLHIIKGLLHYFLVISLMSGCVTNSNLYEQGKQDFLLADYHSAYKILYPIACTGKPDAQYAVGYMQYYGLGTLREPSMGMQWIERAARQGNQQAQKAIQQIKTVQR